MMKILMIFSVIFLVFAFGVRMILNSFARVLNISKHNKQRHNEAYRARHEGVIYEKDDIVVMKGEAKKDSDSNKK